MNSWARWTARTVLVMTGFVATGGGLAGVALASTPNGTNSDNLSVLGGNQISIPVSVPVDACGNAAAILGFATATCQGGATVTGGPQAGNSPAAHGVQIPVIVAADACGNAIGGATAKCHGGVTIPGGTGSLSSAPDPGQKSGDISVASGNDIRIPVSVPVNACGNAVAVLGDSAAGCVGGATVSDQHVVVRGSSTTRSKARGRAVKHTVKRVVSHRARPSKTQLAGLGALPAVASLPAGGGLTGLPILKGLTGGGALLPAIKLGAYSQPAGMGNGSFATLAIGALLAGAAALKLAGGRPRPRTAKGKGASA